MLKLKNTWKESRTFTAFFSIYIIWKESGFRKTLTNILEGADDAAFLKLASYPFTWLYKAQATSCVLNQETKALRVWAAGTIVSAFFGLQAVTVALSLLFIIKPVAGIYVVVSLCMLADTSSILVCMAVTFLGCLLSLWANKGQMRVPHKAELLIAFSALMFTAFRGTDGIQENISRVLPVLFYLAAVMSVRREDDISNLICAYSLVAGIAALAEAYGINISFFTKLAAPSHTGGLFEFYILSIPLAAVCAARCRGIKQVLVCASVGALFFSLSGHVPKNLSGFSAVWFVALLLIRNVRFAVPVAAFVGSFLSFAGVGTTPSANEGALDIGQNLLGRDIISISTAILLMAAIYACGENITRKKALMRNALLAVIGAEAVYYGSGSVRVAMVFWVLLSLSTVQAT